jgi:hypothetical protein
LQRNDLEGKAQELTLGLSLLSYFSWLAGEDRRFWCEVFAEAKMCFISAFYGLVEYLHYGLELDRIMGSPGAPLLDDTRLLGAEEMRGTPSKMRGFLGSLRSLGMTPCWGACLWRQSRKAAPSAALRDDNLI